MKYSTAYIRYLKRSDQRHSGISSFVQKGFPKKEKDCTREDWRVKKGFARDQAKGRQWCKGGRYYKNVDHHSRRAFERDNIHKENWDLLTANDTNFFVSAWDYC